MYWLFGPGKTRWTPGNPMHFWWNQNDHPPEALMMS
jgi:hypothetical protein